MNRNVKKAIFIITISIILVVIILFFVELSKGDSCARERIITTIIPTITSIISCSISLYVLVAITLIEEKTRMEGNVLENKEYKIAFIREIKIFDGNNDIKSFYETLKKEMVDSFDGSTALKLSDSMQRIIDNLLWFAWISGAEDSKGEYAHKLEEQIQEKVEAGVKRNKDISGKYDKVFKANQELIESVMNYILSSKDLVDDSGREYSHSISMFLSGMDNIQDSMIINPISSFVLQNYRGLAYLTQAKHQFISLIGGENNKWVDLCKNYKTVFRKITVNPDTRASFERVIMLVEQAEKHFFSAMDTAKSDSFLQGFVSYNMAVTGFMKWLLLQGSLDAVDIQSLNAVQTRKENKFYFEQILGKQNFATQMMNKEVELAEGFREGILAIESEHQEVRHG